MIERRGKRIGLLGGSFNPAHHGHLHISLRALKVLNLDEIWWLISPQNPLKPSADMNCYEERISQAEKINNDTRIKVSDFESRYGMRHTADTLSSLSLRYPRIKFVWLMGGDLLSEIHLWKEWDLIFESVPIAIFDRWPYAQKCLNSKAAKRFSRYRIPIHSAGNLINIKSPAWVYIFGPLNSISATEIRKKNLLNI